MSSWLLLVTNAQPSLPTQALTVGLDPATACDDGVEGNQRSICDRFSWCQLQSTSSHGSAGCALHWGTQTRSTWGRYHLAHALHLLNRAYWYESVSQVPFYNGGSQRGCLSVMHIKVPGASHPASPDLCREEQQSLFANGQPGPNRAAAGWGVFLAPAVLQIPAFLNLL